MTSKLPFYLCKRDFIVESAEITLIHNFFTGAKRIYVNNALEKVISPHFFECMNKHSLNINGNRYELVVKPRWFGPFDYEINSKEYGTGLLDESLL